MINDLVIFKFLNGTVIINENIKEKVMKNCSLLTNLKERQMTNLKTTLLILLVMISVIFAQESKIPNIDVFYKDQKPSQQALTEINKILEKHKISYKIAYYLITDSVNAGIISKYGLPTTHFPVAVVINGKFTAKLNKRLVSFVHFPDFMKGMGRHEGNWSLADLELVLKDNSLLSDENVLPVLKAESIHGDSKCGE